ncbi:hypothetical protein THOM_2410 [Trachipleistophora hominis]|uniref:Uncharacterized protein n=1 Tax=Trachipleistophora hominis TaxID=72359 RepID=L7JTD6_TRAHO|nr:hypothetical protein THOM_2410 [Trachipleistophora hominis]
MNEHRYIRYFVLESKEFSRPRHVFTYNKIAVESVNVTEVVVSL